MKPSMLVEALRVLIDKHVPTHIWGACGVGKSQIVAQVAAGHGWEFRDIRAVQLDPVDLRGLPRITADWTEWVPPKFLPTTGKGILLLDELTSAPQLTQAGCYQLVLDRRLGEYILPEGWVVIAAGNPASERGVHFSMPRPLRNRFVHLDIEPDLTDWSRWALQNGLAHEIVALLRFRPELLHDSVVTSDQNSWRTPRTWEMASRVLDSLRENAIPSDSTLALELFSGAIGGGGAAELVGFLQLFRQLPSIDEILLTPDTAPLPDDPSSQIAIATALGRTITDQSIGKAKRYLDRMEAEMRVLAMRDAAARDRAITHTPEFAEFGIRHGELL